MRRGVTIQYTILGSVGLEHDADTHRQGIPVTRRMNQKMRQTEDSGARRRLLADAMRVRWKFGQLPTVVLGWPGAGAGAGGRPTPPIAYPAAVTGYVM